MVIIMKFIFIKNLYLKYLNNNSIQQQFSIYLKLVFIYALLIASLISV